METFSSVNREGDEETSAERASYADGVRLGNLAPLPDRRPLERLDRPGDVVMQHGIELVRKPGVEVMAGPLAPGSIDHADRALQAWLAKRLGNRPAVAQDEQETEEIRLVKKVLDAALECRANAFAARRVVPIVGGRHRAAVGREPNENRVAAMPLAHEVADVQLPLLA